MFLCRCRRSKVGGMGFLKLVSQAFPRPLPRSPLVFFPLFRSLYFSLALHYLNAWNRLGAKSVKRHENVWINSLLGTLRPGCHRWLPDVLWFTGSLIFSSKRVLSSSGQVIDVKTSVRFPIRVEEQNCAKKEEKLPVADWNISVIVSKNI